MRNMPTSVDGNPFGEGGSRVAIPSLAPAAWTAKLVEIAGRDLTDEEYQRADEMARHNWTLRVVASELFGEAHVDAYFAP